MPTDGSYRHVNVTFMSMKQTNPPTYLHEEWNAVEATDDGTVVSLTGQNVQSSHSALHDLLHANTIHIASHWRAVGADGSTLQWCNQVDQHTW